MGERDLDTLIRSMKPARRGVYVFCTVDASTFDSLPLRPLGFFEEQEGITVILRQEEAARCGLGSDFTAALITLQVHSDLAAVGFLAFVCSALAKAGISTNVVSAYYHDHLFVPVDTAESALTLLERLAHER